MMSSIYERYERDPHFRTLVDHMTSCIEQLKTTPTEVREAAMLAQIMFEQRNPRRVFRIEDLRGMPGEDVRELCQRMMDRT
jgi:hypothetical protein